VNLLDQFVLKHVQVSLLKAKLMNVNRETPPGQQEAKVELNLTPRLMNADSGDQLPAYQISALLSCKGGPEEDSGAKFVAQVGYEAVYQQVEGEPLDLAEFSTNHASLARQLYPLMQQELRTLLVRLGLEQVRLPFDLASKVKIPEQETVRVSGAVH
jgi:hypothetical protein